MFPPHAIGGKIIEEGGGEKSEREEEEERGTGEELRK